MKFSVNWLREFVELPASIDQLCELLTLAGVEIEGVERRGADFAGVVVAQITASAQHPNADRLSVCEVNDGTANKRQIVCGAKNYKIGDKVPLALPGAELPNDLKIRVSKLRGVESQGMLCSGKELGLSDESAGLLILAPDAEVGAPIGSVFPQDTILAVEVTPNRGDLLSHYGLAREIAALNGVAAAVSAAEPGGLPPETAAATIRVSAARECPFYSARRIENVKVGASPEWLRGKLESVGIRSINNVVDITNFVMFELGQPLHAFDADKLNGAINVRLANDREKFLALDGKTYSLGRDNLVIADSARAVAIAGVMGGEDTGVTDKTRNVLLESAYFLPTSVRRTARKLGLPSDSSYRFERGVDPGMLLPASARATELIRELAGADAAQDVMTAGSLPQPPADVSLRYDRSERLLGAPIQPSRIDSILEGFGLAKGEGTPDSSTWKIPSFRSDLRRESDLIEEIVRVYGINEIRGSNRSHFTPVSAADRTFDSESQLRQRLVALGLSEVRTSALLPRGEALFNSHAVELRNPLSEDHVALRRSLLPGLLQVVERNLRVGASSLRLFELGTVFEAGDASEKRRAALVFCGGIQELPHWRRSGRERTLDLFDAKGLIEALGLPDISFRKSARPNLSAAMEVLTGAAVVGVVGQLATVRAQTLGANAPVFLAELDLTPIHRTERATPVFRELDKYPAVRRDIAMIAPDSLSHEEVMSVIRAATEPLLERVDLFDLFTGKAAENLGAGKKSLAYSLTYRERNRTLTNDEINAVHARIRERLTQELAVELRE